MDLTYTTQYIAGLPQLDIHTLSEDWALATSVEGHWIVQADSLGIRPSCWIDQQGDRMYGAVIWLSTQFDLKDTIREDDRIEVVTEFEGIRKPHALSRTSFCVNGKPKATVRLLTSFIKRTQKGSNKKFAKVRDLWTADDFEETAIDELLDLHHKNKRLPDLGDIVFEYEINRIQDFNTADFLYFKNYVRIAKAAEWKHGRSGPVRLNAYRQCFYYGNVDDGETIQTKVSFDGAETQTTHHDATGKRIFLSQSRMEPVELAIR